MEQDTSNGQESATEAGTALEEGSLTGLQTNRERVENALADLGLPPSYDSAEAICKRLKGEVARREIWKALDALIAEGKAQPDLPGLECS